MWGEGGVARWVSQVRAATSSGCARASKRQAKQYGAGAGLKAWLVARLRWVSRALGATACPKIGFGGQAGAWRLLGGEGGREVGGADVVGLWAGRRHAGGQGTLKRRVGKVVVPHIGVVVRHVHGPGGLRAAAIDERLSVALSEGERGGGGTGATEPRCTLMLERPEAVATSHPVGEALAWGVGQETRARRRRHTWAGEGVRVAGLQALGGGGGGLVASVWRGQRTSWDAHSAVASSTRGESHARRGEYASLGRTRVGPGVPTSPRRARGAPAARGAARPCPRSHS